MDDHIRTISFPKINCDLNFMIKKEVDYSDCYFKMVFMEVTLVSCYLAIKFLSQQEKISTQTGEPK